MPRTGKCPNYAGCLLAYRGEPITVESGAPFVCPECKQHLITGGGTGRKPVAIQRIILGGIILLVLMGAGAVYIQVRHYKENQAKGLGGSFEQGGFATEHPDLMPARHLPDTPAPAPGSFALPNPNVSNDGGVVSQIPNPAGGTEAPDIRQPQAPDSGAQSQAPDATRAPNLDLQNSQNQAVKTDVLKRIDLMPTITQEDKDKLYMSVERARQMGKIVTIPFIAGHTTLGSADIGQLRTVLASPQLKPFLTDPTCVLVVLGYADTSGDEKSNLRISTERAESVLNTLRDQCGVLNVMHAVGMGGSTLFGNEQEAQRNRVVEIWAVLP